MPTRANAFGASTASPRQRRRRAAVAWAREAHPFQPATSVPESSYDP